LAVALAFPSSMLVDTRLRSGEVKYGEVLKGGEEILMFFC